MPIWITSLEMSGSSLVWTGATDTDPEIFFWNMNDGIVRQITDNNSGDYWPVISGSHLAWQGSDGDNEIYYLDVSSCSFPVVTATATHTATATLTSTATATDTASPTATATSTHTATANSDGYSYANIDLYTDGDFYGNSYSNAYRNFDEYADSDGDAYRDGDIDQHSDTGE